MRTRNLRLGPLSKTEIVRFTFNCTKALQVDLERYAELHAQTWGERVDAATLVPHMLEAFMAQDREFNQRRTSRVVPREPESSVALTAEPEASVASPLPETGYLRVHQIIGRPARNGQPAIPALIPVSRSTWWDGVKSGRYPQPVRTLGSNITAWRVEDIRALIGSSRG